MNSLIARTSMPRLERRLARYAQLSSRIGFVHEFRPLGAPEVRTLLAGWRPPEAALPADLLADAEAVASIIRITGGILTQDKLLSGHTDRATENLTALDEYAANPSQDHEHLGAG